MIHPLRRLAAGGGSPSTPSPVPSDWLPLPDLPSGSERFVGLFAVFEAGSNFCALKFSGACTVDWGDGTVEDIAADTQANHEFDYADLPESTLSVCGYRQAIVSVTAQNGQHLTAVSLACRHSSVQSNGTSQWLDVKINIPNCTILKIGATAAGDYYHHNFLWRVNIGEIGAITDLSFLFAVCKVLQFINTFDTAACQDFTGFLYNAETITELPVLNTSAATSIYAMFVGVYRLKRIPAYDFSSVTVTDSAIYVAPSLSSCLFTGLRYTIDLSNCSLSASEIDRIFTNLGTAAGAQTITVTGNYGASGCTPAIAEAKGWTVVSA